MRLRSILKPILKPIHALRRAYWWVVRPTTRGVRGILRDLDGRVLLVRHTYQEGWFLPGGKARRNEPPDKALVRELREELGVVVSSDIPLLGEYLNWYEFKKDIISVFVVPTYSMEQRDHFEIAEKNFFDPQALPERTSPGTRRRIAEALGDATPTPEW